VLTRKTSAANAVISTREKATEVAGGARFLRGTAIERMVRDVHAAQFHPLPEKRQQLFVGRLSTGAIPYRALQDREGAFRREDGTAPGRAPAAPEKGSLCRSDGSLRQAKV
jgi:hypothetical protein